MVYTVLPANYTIPAFNRSPDGGTTGCKLHLTAATKGTKCTNPQTNPLMHAGS